MDSTTTAAKVANIIVEHLSISAEQLIVPGATLHDLGADSLDVVEISMALEDEFGIEILDDEIDLGATDTVEDLVRIVTEKTCR
jgi:acyl carrier protein